MKRLKTLAAIYGVVVCVSISGCSGGGVRTVRVDDHVFHVSDKYLVHGTIPWLPVSQSEGLKFIVNPKARPEEQLIVTIESTATTCHPTSQPASSQLGSVCLAVAQKRDSGVEEQKFTLGKVNRNGDPTQWEYRVADSSGKGPGEVVASCYALSDNGKSGLCTSLSNYNDLVYSVGLRDIDVQHLQTIRAKVREMLTSWESRGQ